MREHDDKLGQLAETDKELVQDVRTNLNIPHADDIRGNITLPTHSKEGVTITWETDKQDVVNVDEVKNQHYDNVPPGVVNRQDEDTTVNLTATLTYGEVTDTKPFTLTIKAKPNEKEYTAYLMATFTGEDDLGEQIYFATSTDAYYWKDMNEGNPVLTSEIGEQGVRDPYIFRSAEGDKIYLIATDLRIASGKGWDWAQSDASKAIIIWESTDLVHWSDPRRVEVAPPNAGDAWAPKAVYDEKTGEYVVIWSSRVWNEDGILEPHKIYYTKTRDFYSFTEPKVYIELPNDQHIIDTAFTKEDGMYYRISVDGKMTIEKSEYILGDWTEVGNLVRYGLTTNVEGPLMFKLNSVDQWMLMVDQYADKNGYLPLVTSDLSSANFKILDASGYSLGDFKKRHGSVLNITQEEYDAILTKWNNNR